MEKYNYVEKENEINELSDYMRVSQLNELVYTDIEINRLKIYICILANHIKKLESNNKIGIV